MKKVHLILVISFLCFMLISFADIVTLKNGRAFQGTILSQSGAYIVVKDEYGIEYKLPKTEVASIISDLPSLIKITIFPYFTSSIQQSNIML